MTDPHNDTADIAWMRQLAEEGGRAPMRGSAILFAAGLIYGGASLLFWAAASDLLSLPDGTLNLVWGVATGLFLLVVLVVNIGVSRRGGVTTTANRAVGAVWSGVGLGIFVLFTSLALVVARLGSEASSALLSLSPSVVMVFYGMGWMVTSTMQKSWPLLALAIGSFIAAPVLAFLSGDPVQFLGYGLALIALMAVPGFLLMRAANRS